MLTRGKIAAFTGIMLLLILGVVELAAAVVTSVLVGRSWMAAIPAFSDEEVSRYFAERNPLLGWGPDVDSEGRVVAPAPRHDPRRTLPDTPCVSAYGDSFTLGSEVGDSAAYPSRLSEMLGCPVANYGVGGFGSDQAMMLFRAQQSVDSAPVVILGHMSENLLRNINQYRNLLYPGQELFFKPRFRLRAQELEYVPIAVQTPQDFEALRRNPEAMLPLEAFIERPRRAFPYSLALLRWGLFDYHVRAELARRPRHASFYAPEHPHHGVELTASIAEQFTREARSAGRIPAVLLMPVGSDLLYARDEGVWLDQPLADALRERGILVVHAGPAMLSRLGDADPCSIFTNCSAHYNERGYMMVAEIVAETLNAAIPRDRFPRPPAMSR